MGARETALNALIACRKSGAWPNGALKEYIARDRLSPRDAALATRLCYGVLQNRNKLDFYLKQLLTGRLKDLHPVVRDILHLGLYQIYELDKVPESAAVNESVTLAKKYCKNPKAGALVNAVLRKAAATKGTLQEPVSYADRYSHPDELISLLKANLPKGKLEPMLIADNAAPRTVVQVNTLRISAEELAERLNISRQSVSKWEGAQSMPDIDKILQLSSLFSVTTDCLLKDTQDDTQPAAAQTPSPLPRVTLAQAEDYLTKAQANAPQMALATALCIVSPIPLLALGTVSELGLLGLNDNLAGGLGMIALVVLVAVAVVLFMQCGAAVREYEFLEKEPIETEHGVTALVRERRAAFAPEYDRANRIGAALCILAAVPLFAAVMVGVSFLMSMSICLLLVLVACGVYAFVRVGTVQDAMDRLLEDGDFTRGHKAVKGRLTALTAAYWLGVVAIFLWYTFGPNGNGQPQYSWFIWAIAGVVYAACVVAAKAFVRKKV